MVHYNDSNISCFKKNIKYNIQVYNFAQSMLSSFNVKGLEALGFYPFQLDITTDLLLLLKYLSENMEFT